MLFWVSLWEQQWNRRKVFFVQKERIIIISKYKFKLLLNLKNLAFLFQQNPKFDRDWIKFNFSSCAMHSMHTLIAWTIHDRRKFKFEVSFDTAYFVAKSVNSQHVKWHSYNRIHTYTTTAVKSKARHFMLRTLHAICSLLVCNWLFDRSFVTAVKHTGLQYWNLVMIENQTELSLKIGAI